MHKKEDVIIKVHTSMSSIFLSYSTRISLNLICLTHMSPLSVIELKPFEPIVFMQDNSIKVNNEISKLHYSFSLLRNSIKREGKNCTQNYALHQ